MLFDDITFRPEAGDLCLQINPAVIQIKLSNSTILCKHVSGIKITEISGSPQIYLVACRYIW